ncbi:MAG: hypothetical protein OHK0032_11420 [Thermodesulfovibrionales bacterium]
MKKLWAGRFKGKTSKIVESFTESIAFDRRLWRYDIDGSIAHARMLGKQGIIPEEDSERIIKGLKEIADEIESGRFRFREDLEDIHMNIEAALIKKIGSTGKKLHTARSRNDQVALDLRLYLRDEIAKIISTITNLQKTLLNMAEKYIDYIMPGYTHMQRAQSVLLSHHLLAYVEMLGRDKERFRDAMRRVNVLPLGACALAGTSLPIDREFVARLLGFEDVAENSIDAVSDRDFAIEFLSDAGMLMMHLSRLAEEIVLWSTEEFSFIELPDAFTTGSSIMPQKKNPDVAELIRGKTGRVYGGLISLLTTMKGLPLSYNRDMQEDKIPVFDSVDTVRACLSVLDEMLRSIKFNKQKMAAAASEGYSTATDIAEYLVRKGMPFREAHETTGRIVLYCIENRKRLEDLKLREFRRFSRLIDEGIYTHLNAEGSAMAKRSRGGTSPIEVKKQIKRLGKTVTLLLMLLLFSVSCGRKGPPTLKAYEKPDAPSALSAVHREDKIILRWSYPDNRRQNIKGFHILRWEGNGFERTSFVDNDKGIFIDAAFKQNTTYRYKVIAQSLKGVLSDDSNIITAVPRPLPSPPEDMRFEIRNDSVELSWKSSGKGVCYNIYKTTEKGRYVDTPLNREPLCITSFKDAVQTDRPVYYSIRALLNTNIMDEGYASKELEVDPSHFIPSAPSDLRTVRKDNRIYLLWKEAPESWVRGYRVSRKIEGETEFGIIGEVRIPAFIDTVKAAGKVGYMIKTLGPSMESEALVIEVDCRQSEL